MYRQICMRLSRFNYLNDTPSDVKVMEIDDTPGVDRVKFLATAYVYDRGPVIVVAMEWSGKKPSDKTEWRQYTSMAALTHELYIRALLGEFDVDPPEYMPDMSHEPWQAAAQADRKIMKRLKENDDE